MDMRLPISPLIEVDELRTLLENDNLVIIDASGGQSARKNFEAKHLKGARFVDLETQLADIGKDVSIGGRHPLPKTEDFANVIGELGINPQSHVVVYDDKQGSNAAARFWWMLKAAGHEKVQVLNGGIQQAEKQNFPMSAEVEQFGKCSGYPFVEWKLPIATIEEVEKVSQRGDHIVIDVRSSERYRGEIEPIDLIAGHILGALNVPFTENLDANGLFLLPNVLKRKFETIIGKTSAENIIVHCGSGITACHTLLAMAYAGIEIPKLYVGSWSEWSRTKL